MESNIIKPVFKPRLFALHGAKKRPRDDPGSHVVPTKPAEVIHKKQAPEQKKQNELDLSIYDVDLNWIDSAHGEDDEKLSELGTSAHDSGPHPTLQKAITQHEPLPDHSAEVITSEKNAQEETSPDHEDVKQLCRSDNEFGDDNDNANSKDVRDGNTDCTPPSPLQQAIQPSEFMEKHIAKAQKGSTAVNPCIDIPENISDSKKVEERKVDDDCLTHPEEAKEGPTIEGPECDALDTEMDRVCSETEELAGCKAVDDHLCVGGYGSGPGGTAVARTHGGEQEENDCCQRRKNKDQVVEQENGDALLGASQSQPCPNISNPIVPCGETLHNEDVTYPTQPGTPDKDMTQSIAGSLYTARNKLKSMGQEITAMNEDLSDMQVEYTILHNRSLMLWNVDLQAKFQMMLEMAEKTRRLLEQTNG